MFFIDQVLKEGPKYDNMTVIAPLESTLQVIYNESPFITEMILQSDNVSTYKNQNVLIDIHLLDIKFINKVFVSEYLHSKTQDRLTILDTHCGACVYVILKNYESLETKCSHKNADSQGTCICIDPSWWIVKQYC